LLKIRELRGEPNTLIKICGIKDVKMAVDTAQAGADFIGLVFANSRRQVTLEQAKEITSAIRQWRKVEDLEQHWDKPTKDYQNIENWYQASTERLSNTLRRTKPLIVGVFANNDVDFINRMVKEVPLDIVQLSGKEGWEIGKHIQAPCWRAIHVGQEGTSHLISQFQPGIFNSILLDTSDPTALGGTGQKFDWSIAKQIQSHVPIILAGGLNPENIQQAVLEVFPLAVDVSSGVETDGHKDFHKIVSFIQLIKNLK